MKFTLGWLKDHLETDASAQELGERLTMIGHELEVVRDRSESVKDFVVAHVLACEPHPDADRLRVCVVDDGQERHQVVCGAPNARAGMKGVFAGTGTYIAGIDVTLKRTTIRGVESNGMLLSEREMGLSDDHAGIVELPDNAPVGRPVAEVFGLDDPTLDIGVTPNRGDCLGVRGVARELVAAGLGSLKPLDAAPIPALFPSPIGVHLEFSPKTATACPYFVGRMIRRVQNGESPKWLRDRLRAIGLRPISALVDITNYITFDLCRPLHVFDADKVNGDLHVRLAHPGESLDALNGNIYALDSDMTVIADDAEAEALGGVIGGERTGCTDSTTNVFVESALFDPVRTAATGRRLNVISDARYRFERGIDPAFLVSGLEIATRLIIDICGGEASELVVAGGEPPRLSPIEFRPDSVRRLIGISPDVAEMEGIFQSLGFEVTDGAGSKWLVTRPTWRNDVVSEACLIEEIARIYGYDKIPVDPLPREAVLPGAALTPQQRRNALSKRVLAGRGLIEAVTLSFVSSEHAALFGGGQERLTLINPISADLDVMRPSLLPNLIAAMGRNADRGHGDGALFEVGPQYAGDQPDEQARVAAGVRAGQIGTRNWAVAPRPVDVFDAKADALALLDALGVSVEKLSTIAGAPDWYHPGRSGKLGLGPKKIVAHFGEINPRILAGLGVRGPIVAFEVFDDVVPAPAVRSSAAKPPLELSALQAVERDFAFVLDRDVAAEALLRAVRSVEKKLIDSVRVFDQFEGEGLPGGKKSLAINVVLQPTQKTLTDSEIEALAAKIVAAVERATGGQLRR